MRTMTRYPTLILSIVVAALPGCSTSFWFTAVLGAAYERCESIKDADWPPALCEDSPLCDR